MGRKDKKTKKILKPERKYAIQNGALCFLPGDRFPRQSAGHGVLGRIQDTLKRYGRVYYTLLYWLGPVYSSFAFRHRLKDLLKKYGKEDVILNIGSGPTYLHGRKDIINADIFAFDEVDIVMDAEELQIRNESIDAVINIAMMEHVRNPIKVTKEMHRVLKEGGTAFCYLPFMQPFHAAPDDFYRWTMSGAAQLFSKFRAVDVFIGAGPASGFLWVFQEWLSILFSFGSKTLHDLLFLLLMGLTWPVKFLDLFMTRMPCAENIASGFCVVARK